MSYLILLWPLQAWLSRRKRKGEGRQASIIVVSPLPVQLNRKEGRTERSVSTLSIMDSWRMFSPSMTCFVSSNNTPHKYGVSILLFASARRQWTSLHGSNAHAQRECRGLSLECSVLSVESLSPVSHEARSLSSCASPPREAPQRCGAEARERKKKKNRKGPIRKTTACAKSRPGQTRPDQIQRCDPRGGV